MRRAAVAAVLLAAAACSGGDGLTKQQFIRQGDAICAGVARPGRMLDRPSGARELSATLELIGREARRARGEFADLEPPTDGDRVQRAMVAFLGTTVTQVGRARTALAAGRTDDAQRALSGVAAPALAAQRAAEDYGFEDCGSAWSAG
jgi:hypothetical protein